MCGIAGLAALDPSKPIDAAAVTPMLRRLQHRGPDDEGVHCVTGVALGHRRLSVIDISGGHQPLFGQRDTTIITINGELYNYRAVRASLEANGHVFATMSDCEVAAHAYDAYGLDFLDHIDGMFALALWDADAQRFILARDRMGEKPLFWCVRQGLLLFASELSALLAHPAVHPSLDPAALSQYLALEYVPAPDCMIHDVHKVEPGMMLIMERGEIRHSRYWSIDPVPREPAPRYDDAVARLRSLLDDAVTSRLVSDVPLGIFLSGGLDSSTIAAFAARAGALETFSIGFREASFDESSYARQVAAHIGSHHHERIVDGSEMAELVPRLGTWLDEPIGDASILPTAILSGFAREHVTVALGGDGGDELFAGYPMHKAQRVARLARGLPAALHGLVRAGARAMPVSHGNFSTGFKALSFLRGAAAPPPYNHALWMSSFSPLEQQALLAPDVLAAARPRENAFAAVEAAWAQSGGAPMLARATHLDATTYLPNDILVKVDRASMAVSLEVRAPFLARAVVEFAFSLPDSYRMRGLGGKRILKDAVQGMIPDHIINRPKKGFGMPVGAWLNGPLESLIRDALDPATLRAAGIFQPAAVTRMLDEHQSRVADHRKPLWTLLVFELWRQANGITAVAGA
ncbi:MAG: asparagine synthase (glutamine-hydrolyzing) [Longimicrobiales bacterium]